MQMLKQVRLDPVEPLRRTTTELIRCVQLRMLFFAGIGCGLSMFIRAGLAIVVMVFVRHSRDIGCGLLNYAVGLRGEYEDGGPVLKRYECPLHCLVLSVVLRGMLKTDDVHTRHTKLD